jgi:hypothetical protein
MEKLAFGELPVSARFYYMGERYVKVSLEGAEFKMRRAFSKTPYHHGDFVSFTPEQPVERVVHKFSRFLPEGTIVPPNGYINGNFHRIECY